MQDDDLLLHSAPADVDHAMAEMRDLGVDRVRLSVIWRDLAPATQPSGDSYPAGPLAYLDTAVQTASKYGIDVLLNVRGPAPDWAQPRHIPARFAGRNGYMPDPNRFRLFVQMLGKRYPGVHAWSVWNEPNWGGHLQPQTIRDRRTHRLVTVAPRVYRRLFRAATSALGVTGHGQDQILLGETAPIGSPKLGELAALKPLRFLRDLFCLDRRLRPLRGRASRAVGCDYDKRGPLLATGYAHHPYAVVSPPWQPTAAPDDVTLADLPRLYRVLDAAQRAHRIGRLPVWLTEFGYQTAPPDPYRGVSLADQASWLVAAEHQTWQDPRVAGLTQFLLRDAGPDPLYPASNRRYWGTYQTGLRFFDGSPKPAYEAYRLPLLAPDGLEPGRPLTLWGMVRPAPNGVAQHVRIEYRGPGQGDWSQVSEVDVGDPRGYFQTTLPAAEPGEYRFEWVRAGPPAPGGGSTLLAVR